jgi:hypothetical protein
MKPGTKIAIIICSSIGGILLIAIIAHCIRRHRSAATMARQPLLNDDVQ